MSSVTRLEGPVASPEARDVDAGRPAERPIARQAWLVRASIVAGVAGGLASLAYLTVLSVLKVVLWPGRVSPLVHVVLLVAVGAVISAALSVLRDPGPTGAMVKSIHIEGGPQSLRALRSLVPVSLLGIAVGGGIGPEPPLMQTTATIGSWIGRRLGASRAELRVLTVTGLASGLTVLFSAPLGAAIFALEILHRKGLEYYEALLPACAGSTASYAVYAVVTRRGLTPAWQFPGVQHLTVPDLLLGVAGGVAGAAVVHLFSFMISVCARISALLPSWIRPPAAGLALAVLGLILPSGLTYGDTQLSMLVALPAVAILTLLLAAFGHLASAAITLAGRWKGGIIIPMFFTGYCVGRALAEWTGHDGWYVVLAASMMVACNTGMTKTPLGSALVVSEMTALTLVPPLVIAALVSLCLTTRVTFVGGQRHREQPEQPPAPQHDRSLRKLAAGRRPVGPARWRPARDVGPVAHADRSGAVRAGELDGQSAPLPDCPGRRRGGARHQAAAGAADERSRGDNAGPVRLGNQR